jgi:hypothetical protein
MQKRVSNNDWWRISADKNRISLEKWAHTNVPRADIAASRAFFIYEFIRYETRVTRLGEFSSLGRLFTFDSFAVK